MLELTKPVVITFNFPVFNHTAISLSPLENSSISNQMQFYLLIGWGFVLKVNLLLNTVTIVCKPPTIFITYNYTMIIYS